MFGQKKCIFSLFFQFADVPRPKTAVYRLGDIHKVHQQSAQDSRPYPRKDIQRKVLTEVNPRVCAHRSEQEEEQRPQVLAAPIIRHRNETEREKEHEECGGVPRGERQPIVHPYAIGQRQRNIGHILGKPRQGAGSTNKMLYRLYHKGSQQYIAREKYRPARAIQQQEYRYRVRQPIDHIGVEWQHCVQEWGMVVAKTEVQYALWHAKQGYPQRKQEQQCRHKERTNVGDP